jgi:murein DD-endopeptidase MepM/ murein hydrolase activator NlpD
MRKFALLAPILWLSCCLASAAGAHSAFPIDVVVARSPQPVAAGGQTRLLYELRLTNFAPKPIWLTGLDVSSDAGTLASYRGEAIEPLLLVVGGEDGTAKPAQIGVGRSVVVFLDVALAPDSRVPGELHHRLSFSVVGEGGTTIDRSVDGPAIAVSTEPAPVLQAPLRGAGWVAANGLSNPQHRRSLMPVDGRARIAQRFAIDWVQLGPDGRLYRGEPNDNRNYPGYGAAVLAVADGVVADIKDGLAENAGSNAPTDRSITLDSIAGNYLILDLGHQRYALYAHLQPGSFKVKPGDRVKTGQPLALLGNSGNSDAPHLHFHLVDGNSALGAEGIPYVLESFRQSGAIDAAVVLEHGEPWRRSPASVMELHRREFPMDNAVITFMP